MTRQTSIVPSAHDFAARLVRDANSGPDRLPMDPLRLHKLLSLAQGWCFALTGKPLFPERVEAADHGFFIREVDREVCRVQGRGRAPLRRYGRGNPDRTLTDTEELVWKFVFRRYGACSGARLRELMHGDGMPLTPLYRRARRRRDRTVTPEELALHLGAEVTPDGLQAFCRSACAPPDLERLVVRSWYARFYR